MRFPLGSKSEPEMKRRKRDGAGEMENVDKASKPKLQIASSVALFAPSVSSSPAREETRFRNQNAPAEADRSVVVCMAEFFV